MPGRPRRVPRSGLHRVDGGRTRPADSGEGWPGASAGDAGVAAPADGTDGCRDGGLVVGWGGLRVSSPITPFDLGATDAGTSRNGPVADSRSSPRRGGNDRAASKRRSVRAPRFPRPEGEPGPRRSTDGQTLGLELWVTCATVLLVGAETLRELLRRQEVVVVGRGRVRHPLHLRCQSPAGSAAAT